MAPAPEPTPAPAPAPTAAPQYDYNSLLSSLNNELSSLYSVYGITSNAYDENYFSSLLSSYSSLYGSYSVPGFSYSFPSELFTSALPGATPTSQTGAPRITSATATDGGATDGPTPLSAQNNDNGGGGSKGGLSTGAKVGIGVGVPLGVFALIGVGIFLWCLGKKKGQKSKPSGPVAPPPEAMAGANNVPPTQQFNPSMVNAPVQGQQQPWPMPTPPPQYGQVAMGDPNMTAYHQAGMVKPEMNVQARPVAEMEQSYHFTGTGAVEMEAGEVPVQGVQGQQGGQVLGK